MLSMRIMTKGVRTVSGSDKLLSDELVSSVAENQIQQENDLCAPLSVSESDRCTASYLNEKDLKRHICSNNIQMTDHHCGICFKKFVSLSKFAKHYAVHTGQRPLRCGICGLPVPLLLGSTLFNIL